MYVAPLAGAWIEILAIVPESNSISCRSPCGSVDRNTIKNYSQYQDDVAPLAGAWIEIS